MFELWLVYTVVIVGIAMLIAIVRWLDERAARLTMRAEERSVTDTVTTASALDPKYRPSEDEPYMGERQLAYFRKKLLDWKDDIQRQTRETSLGANDSVQYGDPAAGVHSEDDHRLELRARARQQTMIAKIDAAVRRIDDGTYGYCEETGEPIGVKRLDARPIATMAQAAQERHERRERVYRYEADEPQVDERGASVELQRIEGEGRGNLSIDIAHGVPVAVAAVPQPAPMPAAAPAGSETRVTPARDQFASVKTTAGATAGAIPPPARTVSPGLGAVAQRTSPSPAAPLPSAPVGRAQPAQATSVPSAPDGQLELPTDEVVGSQISIPRHLPTVTPGGVVIRIGEKLAKAQFDTVQTSVFAPTVAPLDQQFLVQVWLHTPEMVEAAAAGAGEADPGSARKTVRSLLAEIARGAKVEVELISPELDIDAAERTKTLIWRGRPEAYDFIVRVSAKSGIRDIFPTVVVTADGIPVGSVRFKLSCAPKIAPRYPTTRAMPAPGLAAGLAALGGSTDLVAADADGYPYRKAFISYSNKDIDEAVLIATGLQAGNPGLEYFIDVATMRAGDNWRQRIQDYIGGCDLFVLVWSNNAKASSEVENEWRYALVQAATRDGGGPVVHPVPIEGPPIPTPPPELAHINFRDRLQYIRVAAAAGPSVQTRR